MRSLILLLIYQKKLFRLFASHISHLKADLTQHKIFDKIRLTVKCAHVSELNLTHALTGGGGGGGGPRVLVIMTSIMQSYIPLHTLVEKPCYWRHHYCIDVIVV